VPCILYDCSAVQCFGFAKASCPVALDGRREMGLGQA
jgi:hypothetical protein